MIGFILGQTNLREKNWTPINDHIEQCIRSITFKFYDSKSSAYMNDAFQEAGHPNSKTKASFFVLNQPLRKIDHGQKSLSHRVPNIWNSLTDLLKETGCLKVV